LVQETLANMEAIEMAQNGYITPALFDFFRELKANNNRAWFQANKERYERQVREPLLQFVADFGVRLAAITPYYVADVRRNGGSLFRINRDVRFLADKSPFKTAAGIQFRHESGKDVHAPGFYLHLEPGGVFAGIGLWQPDSRSLGLIRDAIVNDSARWQQIVLAESFRATFMLGGESLKRPPKGYDPAHPLIEDLKRKDFIASTPFTETAPAPWISSTVLRMSAGLAGPLWAS
jgi:uncharacterized protein (TIGR02453 family)